MRILAIIPANNEERNIAGVVEELRKESPGVDIIVIDDGSTDATAEVCHNASVPLISLPFNLGIGGAMQTGYKYAQLMNYDIAVQVDGDGQHNTADLKKLLKPLQEKACDMVIGSRFIENNGYKSTPVRRIGIKYLSALIYYLTGQKHTDVTSGFRACNSKVIAFFAYGYPADYPEPESIVSLHRLGYRILEVPVSMRPREHGQSSIDFFNTIYYLIKVSLAILLDASKRTWFGGKDCDTKHKAADFFIDS